MTLGFFDRQGQPITQQEWATLHSDMKYRRLASDDLEKHWVSTVWLGMNHNWGEGAPHIFETMVFPKLEDSPTFMEDYMERYATEQEALEGHARIVNLVKKEEIK